MTITQRHINILSGLLFSTLLGYGQTLTPLESLKRGYLLDNFPNLFNYDKTHSDSVPYYYDYFLRNVNTKEQNYGLGIFYTANYYFEKRSFTISDSLFILFLNIKQPKTYKDISIKAYFSPDLNPKSYFHYVYESLCDIKLEQQKFSEALKYITQAERSSFQHFCGNAYKSRAPYLADKKAKCYIGLNQQESALKILLPHIFNKYYGKYDDLIRTTAKLLKDRNKDATKEIVEKAFREMKTEKVKYEKTTFDEYFIEINGVKINIPTPNFSGENKEMDYIKYIWNSDFYKLIKD